MSTCLGIYIENNLIKYAKVSKEQEHLKVELFGVTYYDDLEKKIKQIIDETYSYKVPISINLSDEMYNYFNMFALLNKNDLQKAIKTEFESYCSDKKYNPNVFETRYVVVPNIEQKNQLKVIHISENKIELNKKNQQFSQYRLTNILPVSMTIPNIAKTQSGEKALIVNIEGKTTITTIIDQQVYDIKVLDKGSEEFLDKINIKENSYMKAYQICKETTIYTSEGKELTEQETGYLEEIMPTLYDILVQVRKTINESSEKIEKVYITGTGALINNIDLYFEEYLEDIRCEILKPNFIKLAPDINIKEYIEVNSAISLALNGLGEGIKGINFKQQSISEKLPKILKLDVSLNSKKDNKNSKGNLFTPDFNMPLDKTEKVLLRTAVALLILFFVYTGFSNLISKQIDKKLVQVDESISNTRAQIKLIQNDKQKINSKISNYETILQNLEDLKKENQEKISAKKIIPNLLNQLMYSIPQGVQITSIQNTNNRHIVIQAQANDYDQLGFFKSVIQNDVLLTNVISSTGEKENNIVVIRIEGDMP